MAQRYHLEMTSTNPQTSWAAEVEGHPVDLHWAEEASAKLTLNVSRHQDGMWLLTSPTLAGLADTGAVEDEAVRLLSIVNGAGAVHDPGFRPLTVGHIYRFRPGGGKDAFVLLKSTVTVRSALVLQGGTPVPPGPSLLEKATAAGQADADLQRALELFGGVPPTWGFLYNVYELSKQQPELKKWTSQGERTRFQRTANSFTAAGSSARHAVEKTVPPPNPMTLAEARAFIRRILDEWVNHVWSLIP